MNLNRRAFIGASLCAAWQLPSALAASSLRIVSSAARVWTVFLALWTGLLTAPTVSGEAPPLRIDPDCPNYFRQPDGKPVVLIGDYTWGTFSDVDYDYAALFDQLKAKGLNFARIWLWWGGAQFPPPDDKPHVEPFLRPGPGLANDGRPKYDLSRFNPVFFDRLHDLCTAAQQRGLFLQLITMDAWMLKHPQLWKLHAFQRDNNINGVDGDPRNTSTGTDGQEGFCSLGNPNVLRFQEAYLRKIVEAVRDSANVLIEIANENYYNVQWERQLCEFIRQRERSQAGPSHLLVPLDLLNHSSVVQEWNPRAIHAALLAKRALRQPLIFDTDWTINPKDNEVREAMWTAVLSGGHFNYMDDSLDFGAKPAPDKRAALHRQIGHLAAFVQPIKLWEMQPGDAPVKSGYAFAMAATNALAAYLPNGGAVTLDLAKLSGAFQARWFDPRGGSFGEPFGVAGGRAREFKAPDEQDWGLLLQRQP
jgi:hypothetical protein